MTASDLLAGLEYITLDELVERAGLQTRVDRKYVVPRGELRAVLADLPERSRVLDIDGIRGAAYESVYFDTPDLASYLAAARKRRRRFKIRTRAYLDSGDAYLEVKTRGGRSTTVKDRLEYDFGERSMLTREGRSYVDLVLGEVGVGDLGERSLRPMLSTSYIRTTILVPGAAAGAGSRATIDEDLRWAVDEEHGISLPDLAIVETKSGSSPSPVDRLLWSHGHRPDGISKYGVGMAALHPDLPANKWSRVLSRHFPGAGSRLSAAASPKRRLPSPAA